MACRQLLIRGEAGVIYGKLDSGPMQSRCFLVAADCAVADLLSAIGLICDDRAPNRIQKSRLYSRCADDRVLSCLKQRNSRKCRVLQY